LRLGRINSLRFPGLAALNEQLGERPVAATHVDPLLARRAWFAAPGAATCPITAIQWRSAALSNPETSWVGGAART
jgi:hypothetical protein